MKTDDDAMPLETVNERVLLDDLTLALEALLLLGVGRLDGTVRGEDDVVLVEVLDAVRLARGAVPDEDLETLWKRNEAKDEIGRGEELCRVETYVGVRLDLGLPLLERDDGTDDQASA